MNINILNKRWSTSDEVLFLSTILSYFIWIFVFLCDLLFDTFSYELLFRFQLFSVFYHDMLPVKSDIPVLGHFVRGCCHRSKGAHFQLVYFISKITDDRKIWWSLVVHKTFLELHNWRRCGLESKNKKGSIKLIQSNPSIWKPKEHNLIWK